MAELVEPDTWQSEPPCWGSAEIGLLPKSWERLMGRSAIQIVTKIKKSGAMEIIPASLGNFSRSNWSASWFSSRRGKGSRPLLEQVIDGVRSRFDEVPDLFDIPIFAGHVIGETKSMDLPFLVSTWGKLEDLGLNNSKELDSLFSGTYAHAFELLGKDVQALLDITVTGCAWVDDSRKTSMVFRSPQRIESVESFLQQTCLRSYRNVGIDPAWGQYSEKCGQVFPKRWGITLLRRYTLESAGNELSITRERARQLEERFPISFEPRRWPLPSIFMELQQQLSSGNLENFSLINDDEIFEVFRKNASDCLIACGVTPAEVEPFGGIDARLRNFGVNLDSLRREAYWMSDRVGILFREQFLTEIMEDNPNLPVDLLEGAIQIFATDTELPYGYMFVESKSGSFLRSNMQRVLSRNGSLEFNELYAALVRYFRWRTAGRVFPPSVVLRAVLDADAEFKVDNDFISIVEPVSHNLGASYEWMWQTISDSPGLVIHRTELLKKGREEGLNTSTLQVYFSYSLYFKQAGNNCVTLTGHEPIREDVDYARARASLITIPTKILDWYPKGHLLTAVVEVGNSLLDGGLLSLSKAARTLLRGKGFEIYLGDEDFGSSNLSGVVYTGWQTVLGKGSFSVGDHIAIVFDLVKRTAHVAMAEDLNEGDLGEAADSEF